MFFDTTDCFHIGFYPPVTTYWSLIIVLYSLSVGNIAKKGVKNTQHWSGQTETATENGVAQLDYVVIAAAMHQWRRQ